MVDPKLRDLIIELYYVNKHLDQNRLTCADVSDSRLSRIGTQLYTTKQDIEDKIREDYVDAPIQIANAPNLPPQTSTTQSSSPITPQSFSQPITPATGVPNSGMNGVPVPTPVPAPNTSNSGSMSNGNIGTNTVNQNDVASFFTSVLAGNASNNEELNDFLKTMNSGNASGQQTGNIPNF